MNTILFDSRFSDHERRGDLYNGQLFAFSNRASVRALCDLARKMAEEAFAPLDPITAQHHMPVEQYAAILADLKPKFIHHPNAKQRIQGILEDFGCDLSKTYFDVPRLRTATSENYLTSGIAYAFHPHRDTWYSAPHSQQNWWLPVYPIVSDNSMAFHPRYWNQPVRNGSNEYNYYEWNQTSRKEAAQHVKTDTRKQPHAEEPLELDPQIRLIVEVGGVIIFSGAQMHSTVPNTSSSTRFSIDFRVVNIDDVVSKTGAPNRDSACTGTTLRDFLRASDFARMPEEIAVLYDDGTPPVGELVFKPMVEQSQDS